MQINKIQSHELPAKDILRIKALNVKSKTVPMTHAPAMHREKITPYYKALLHNSRNGEVLARMMLFSQEELVFSPLETSDPIGDERHLATDRLIHRYPDRALLLVTGRCPAHCRFCFRKSLKRGKSKDINDAELGRALEYLSAREQIHEVILSGGDPLSLPDSRLAEIVSALKALQGNRQVRIHTRYPVFDPARCLKLERLPLLVDRWAIHVNHALEITDDFKRAAAHLGANSVLLSQTVLLKGVNDRFADLSRLMNALLKAGMTPYYLHVLDRAPGTAHFQVKLAKAIALARALRKKVPAASALRLMLDLPGGHGKIEPDKGALLKANGGFYFRSPISGEMVFYTERRPSKMVKLP